MRYTCARCDQTHDDLPSLVAEAPLYFYSIPAEERRRRCRLESETCVVDERFFFVRGCLEVPIHDVEDPFVWGVWVSLSEASFRRFGELIDTPDRSSEAPFFGWLSAGLRGYPDTENLKTQVHLRDRGERPSIELEPTDHPLAIDQRSGIPLDRVIDILSLYRHGG